MLFQTSTHTYTLKDYMSCNFQNTVFPIAYFQIEADNNEFNTIVFEELWELFFIDSAVVILIVCQSYNPSRVRCWLSFTTIAKTTINNKS